MFNRNIEKYDNCEIMSVWSRCSVGNNYFGNYLIKINIIEESSYFPSHTEIQIDCRDFKNKLLDIVNNKTDREYFSYNMTDIDIFKFEDKNSKEKYGIEWSPCASTYITYVFEPDNFIKDLVEVVS